MAPEFLAGRAECRKAAMGKKLVYFEDIVVGSESWGQEWVAEKEELLEYGRTFDRWPFHSDEAAAKNTRVGEVVASGGYTIGLWYRSLNSIIQNDEQEWAFITGFDWKVKFLLPVRPGDALRMRLRIPAKRLSSKPGRGIVTFLGDLLDRADRVAFSIEGACMVATRPADD